MVGNCVVPFTANTPFFEKKGALQPPSSSSQGLVDKYSPWLYSLMQGCNRITEEMVVEGGVGECINVAYVGKPGVFFGRKGIFVGTCGFFGGPCQGGGGSMGHTQFTKRSTHARPGMHMQQCSAVLPQRPQPRNAMNHMHPNMCTLHLLRPCFVNPVGCKSDRGQWGGGGTNGGYFCTFRKGGYKTGGFFRMSQGNFGTRRRFSGTKKGGDLACVHVHMHLWHQTMNSRCI